MSSIEIIPEDLNDPPTDNLVRQPSVKLNLDDEEASYYLFKYKVKCDENIPRELFVEASQLQRQAEIDIQVDMIDDHFGAAGISTMFRRAPNVVVGQTPDILGEVIGIVDKPPMWNIQPMLDDAESITASNSDLAWRSPTLFISIVVSFIILLMPALMYFF